MADDEGNPVIGARYDRTDDGEYVIEPLEAESLLDWFPDIEVRGSVATPVGGVSYDLVLGSVRGLVDLVAGAVFLRGPLQFIRAWGLATLAVIGTVSVGYASESQTLVAPAGLLLVTGLMLVIGVVWLGIDRVRESERSGPVPGVIGRRRGD